MEGIYTPVTPLTSSRTHKLCESRDGRPGLPVPNSPYGLCDSKDYKYKDGSSRLAAI